MWTRLPDSPGLGDYEVRPRRSWNVALAVSATTVDDVARVERLGVQSPPWGLTTGSPPFGLDGVPVKVWLPGRRVPRWRLVDDDVPPPPPIEENTAEPDVFGPLVPYGSTRLRIAELPNAAPSQAGPRSIDQAPV